MMFNSLLSGLRTQAAMQLDIIALCHQLTVMHRGEKKRLILRRADRFLWVWLFTTVVRLAPGLIIVKPDLWINAKLTHLRSDVLSGRGSRIAFRLPTPCRARYMSMPALISACPP